MHFVIEEGLSSNENKKKNADEIINIIFFFSLSICKVEMNLNIEQVF